jgi:hypothetical protein
MHLVAAGKPQKISFNCSHIFQPNSVGHLKNRHANTMPKIYDLKIFYFAKVKTISCIRVLLVLVWPV